MQILLNNIKIEIYRKFKRNEIQKDEDLFQIISI
jgi:hypothetical protein